MDGKWSNVCIYNNDKEYIMYMSYCRHQNTVIDLEQVVEEWDNFDENEASNDEVFAREHIIKLAKIIIEMEE